MTDSPYINHFIQPDTIIPNQGNPQSWNRYSYVSNNPLRYTDPSGHRACEDYGGSCVSENQMTRIVQTKIARLHERQNRYYRNDTPKDDAVTTTAYSNYTATATLPSFATVTSAPTSTSMTTYLTTPLATNVPYVVGAAPTVTPTGMPAPTSEFWAITRDKHSPGGEFIPDTTVPFGANYDLWSVVDAAAKYLGPLAGYPAMTKNITDFWTGKAAVPIINAAADFIVSRGAGAFYIPNNSLISPPPVQQ